MINQLNDQDFQLIEHHLAGILSEDEDRLFSEKMKDPDFEKNVVLIKELVKGIEIDATERLKASLQEEEIAIQKNKKGRLSRKVLLMRVILSTAAIVGFLLIAVWWFSLPSNIYAEHFEPHKNVLVPIKLDATTKLKKEEVFRQYDNNAFEAALEGFDELLALGDNADYLFYKANTLLSLGRIDEAIIILQELLKGQETQFMEESKWYLALAYIKLENYDSARPLLEALNSNPFYQDEVQTILNDTRFK